MGRGSRGGVWVYVGGHSVRPTVRVPKLSGSWLSWLLDKSLCVREEGVTGERQDSGFCSAGMRCKREVTRHMIHVISSTHE